MNTKQLQDKLKELGIDTKNSYPKGSFLWNDTVVMSAYDRELKEDFYFYNSFDKTIYKIPKGIETSKVSDDQHYISKDKWVLVWEDKPFEELPDKSYREMTLREYACIQLKVAKSGLVWLDEIINSA